MRPLNILFLVLGLALLGLVLHRADLGAVVAQVGQLSLLGALAVLLAYLVSFVVDTLAWQVTLPGAALSARWLYRLWQLRMVGEAYNVLFSIGGEPVKAVLLKKHQGIGYKEGAASLIIVKTVYVLALIAFAAVGLGLMRLGGAPISDLELVAWAGLSALTLGIGGFFAVQRWGATSWLVRWGTKFGRAGAPFRFVDHVHDLDHQFHGFYARRPGGFMGALALAFLGWVVGVVELYMIFFALGEPITWREAWIIEAAVQLVRAGTFFIPGRIGANEVGLVVVVEALLGQPSLGLAAALVRRGREVLWIAWGFALGWGLSLKPGATDLESG